MLISKEFLSLQIYYLCLSIYISFTAAYKLHLHWPTGYTLHYITSLYTPYMYISLQALQTVSTITKLTGVTYMHAKISSRQRMWWSAMVI